MYRARCFETFRLVTGSISLQASTARWMMMMLNADDGEEGEEDGDVDDGDDDQRWKNVQILQIYLCYLFWAVLIFWLYMRKQTKTLCY